MSQMLGIELEIWSFIFAFIAIGISTGKEVILPLWIKPKIDIFYNNDDECISSSPFKDRQTTIAKST